MCELNVIEIFATTFCEMVMVKFLIFVALYLNMS